MTRKGEKIICDCMSREAMAEWSQPWWDALTKRERDEFRRWAADYRRMQAQIDSDIQPPCVQCSDAVVSFCTETEAECAEFYRYCPPFSYTSTSTARQKMTKRLDTDTKYGDDGRYSIMTADGLDLSCESKLDLALEESAHLPQAIHPWRVRGLNR